MKDRTALTASAVVLAAALLASGVMLVKAWKNMSPPPELVRARARLNTTMDEVHAELAANESLLRVRGIPATQSDAAALEKALSRAARETRDAVSRDGEERFPVQFAAVAFHVSETADDMWLASPLGNDDARWLRQTLGKLVERHDGSAYESQETRSLGLAFATFEVAGKQYRGGIYWMLGQRAAR